MVAEEELEQCIDKLYGAISAPDSLADAIRTIRLTFQASGATHLHFDRAGNLARFVDDGHDPAHQQLYLDHFASIDPTRTLLSLHPGEWLVDDRLLDPKHTSQPEFVNDFAPRIAMRWFRGCKVHADDNGVSCFSLQRGRDAPPFDDETLVLLKQLQPHLKRVFRMVSDVAMAVPAIAAGGAVLDLLRMAVCVVDHECRLLYANPMAEDLLVRSQAVTIKNGRVTTSRPEASEMLRHAVALACRPPRLASAFSPEPEASAMARLQVRAVPLARHLAPASYGHGSLALLVLTAGSPAPQPRELQLLFGLTRAEADLICLLAQGVSPELCAVRRGVSITTIRTQLASIYDKTGVGSQTQLVSLVLALPPMR
jgi:DNA-binding CsgD family transcriptional regulator